MTTVKTGDLTKAQIVAKASDISKIQWNKALNYHALKAILTSEDFVPTTPSDWTSAPTTQQAALDELGSRSSVGAETNVNNVFTAYQTIDNELAIRFREATAGGTNYVALKAPSALAADYTLTLPAATDTLATLGMTETVTGIKTYSAANVHFATLTLVDAATNPKAIGFLTTAATASTKITLAARQTGNISVRLPVAAGDLALTSDIGADVRAVASVTLTDTNVKDLHNTPVELIAAPAAGSYIVIEMIEFLTTGTVGYDGVAGGEDFTVQYSTAGANIATAETTGWIDQASAAGRIVQPAHLATAIVTPATATNVTIKNSGAVFVAAGNHGLKIKCYYRVLTALT